MATIGDLRNIVRRFVQDKADFLTDNDLSVFIKEAVKEYSKERPRRRFADIAGVTSQFDYALPTGFDAETSLIRTIEFPVGSREPAILEPNEFTVYFNGTNFVLRFLTVTPSTGQTARVQFTSVHTVDITTSTIPDLHFETVANLSAAFTFFTLAARFAESTDPTIPADVVNYIGKVAEYRSLAQDFLEKYKEGMGIDRDVKPGSKDQDWDARFLYGLDTIWHPKVER